MFSRIQSSFPGKISEIPGIAADNFEGENLKSRAFFLSHCHSDHTRGLFSKELLTVLKINEVFVYMSDLSKAIVADDCKSDPTLMKYIKTLDSGANDVTLPELFGYNEQFLKVTLIPAGHCLGSVMFLFEANSQTVLYTGDFNISSNDFRQIVAFHDKNKKPIRIDAMYVDTTFIDCKYEYFPKRSEVVMDVINIIKKWLDADEKNRVSLSLSAKYGYEYVFKEIYKKLGMKVYVNEERWAFYSEHQQLREGVTNQEQDTKIHICGMRKGDHRWCSITQIKKFSFLFIRFSAMSWTGYKYEAPGVIHDKSEDKVNVCFATHCSSTQIKNFVDYFSPKKVVGFPKPYPVSDLTSPIKITHFEEVNKNRKRKIFTPEKNSIADRKIETKILKRIFEV